MPPRARRSTSTTASGATAAKRVKYGSTPTPTTRPTCSPALPSTRSSSAPADQPIFAWIAPTAAHDPLTPAPRDANAPCTQMPDMEDRGHERGGPQRQACLRPASRRSSGRSHDLVPLCRVLMGVDDAFVADPGRAHGHRALGQHDVRGRRRQRHGLRHAPPRRRSTTSACLRDATAVHHELARRHGLQPRSVDTRLQNIDFAPTICELVGCTLGPYPNGQSQARRNQLPTRPDGHGAGAATRRRAVDPDGAEAERAAVGRGDDHVRLAARPPGLQQRLDRAAASGTTSSYSDGTRELYDDSGGPCYAWHQGMPGDPCELPEPCRQEGLHIPDRDTRRSPEAADRDRQ